MTTTAIDPLEHQGLVRQVAKQYARFGRRCGLERDDLIGHGQIGLIRACRLFDPDRGFAFTTYATYSIRTAILRAIVDGRWPIRLPAEAWAELAGHGSYPPEPGTRLADAHFVAHATSFGEHQMPGGSLEPVLADRREAGVAGVERADWIKRALATLPRYERETLVRRYGLLGGTEQTQQQVAGEIHLSRQRVQDHERAALRRLRKRFAEWPL